MDHSDKPCQRPDLNQHVTGYCFGDATPEEREKFEEHLLQCDFCWSEVQRLDRAVSVLRSDKDLTRSTFLSDVAGAFGISAGLGKPFGGHGIHAFVSSFLYALLFATAVPVEIAYQWGRLGSWSLQVATLVFIWMFAITLACLAADRRIVVSGGRAGLISILIAAGCGIAMYVVLRPFLPNYGITQTLLHTSYTAQSAYLKDLSYALPFGIAFLLLPFHFVLAMQKELWRQPHQAVLGILNRDKMSVRPRGAIYPRWSVLCALFCAGGVVSFLMALYLFDNLKNTSEMNRFVHLIELRWGLFFVLGAECLGWYYLALDDLKRECLAFLRISQRVEPD